MRGPTDGVLRPRTRPRMNRRLGAPRAARLHLAALSIMASFAVLAGPAAAAPRAATDIVQLRKGVSLADGRQLVRAAHGEVTGTLPIVNGLAARLSPGARARLRGDARVAAVSANAAVRSQRTSIRPPADAVDASHLETAYPYSVLAPQSWDSATGRGIGVAV